jgi:hypothetical protein
LNFLLSYLACSQIFIITTLATAQNGPQKKKKNTLVMAGVNQQLPQHHEGWMVDGKETLFHWVPFP